MWGADGMIYFSSERDGTFNIWKIAAGGASQPQKKVTFHKRMASSSRRSARTGRRSSTRTSSTSGRCRCRAARRRGCVSTSTSIRRKTATSAVSTTNKADTFSPSHEGDYLAVDFHGEVFVATDADVGEKAQVTASGWRDQNGLTSPTARAAYPTSRRNRRSGHSIELRAAPEAEHAPSFKEIGAWSPGFEAIAYSGANQDSWRTSRRARRRKSRITKRGAIKPSVFARWQVARLRTARPGDECRRPGARPDGAARAQRDRESLQRHSAASLRRMRSALSSCPSATEASSTCSRSCSNISVRIRTIRSSANG